MSGTWVGWSAGQAVTVVPHPLAGWPSPTSCASPPPAAATSSGTWDGTTATMAIRAATSTTSGA